MSVTVLTRIYCGWPPDGQHIDSFADLEGQLAHMSGGLTITYGLGVWEAPDGSLVREACVVYEVLHSKHLTAYVTEWAERMRVARAQKEVLVVKMTAYRLA